MSSATTSAPSVAASNPIANPIAMSPDYATGLVIGIFLAMMVAFAAYMMLSIQTGDQMSTPDSAYKLPEKKQE